MIASHNCSLQVVQLMLRANNVFELVGNLSPQGTRTEGALDYYFSKKEVCSFIKHAAEVLEKDTNDRDKVATAGKLFMLAGNFRALLRLLSKLLSPATTDVSKLFSPDRTGVQTDGDKKYWYEQAQGFFNTYFDNGPTHVSDCVIKNKDTDAVDTCKALMMLSYCFDRFGNGAHESARSILDRLDIIPKTLSDVSSKEARYRTLDKLFQEAIPAALEATLRSLRHEYYHLKSSYGSKDDVRNALIQVKERAKAIVTFAGLIAPNVDPDKRKYLSQLAQWEAEMI